MKNVNYFGSRGTGSFRAVQFPTQDEITASVPRFFMGGHQYVVDDQTRTDLINGGVGVTAANFVPFP